MHAACQIVASILDDVNDCLVPGITTLEIDEFINQRITYYGVTSATIGYRGYNHASCISPNHVVCHGIPSKKVLKTGDIFNVDITIIKDGWFGDSSRMFFLPPISVKAKRLIKVVHDALMLGITKAKPGATFGDIGHAIQQYAQKHRYGVVRDFCGHGIGRSFHMPPHVLHYGEQGQGEVLQEGMYFTIEPMINIGGHATKVLPDAWTAVTRDGSLSAQFEHTIAITTDGCKILTESPKGVFMPAV